VNSLNVKYGFKEFVVDIPVATATLADRAVALLQQAGANEAAYTGRAPVLTAKQIVDDWTFMPYDEDTCTMPAIAWQRIILLQQAGIVPISYVIGHEPVKKPAQALMPAKVKMEEGWNIAKSRLTELKSAATPVAQQAAESAKRWAVAAAPVALGLAKVTLVATGVAVASMSVLALATVGAAASVLAIDPCLYALLPAEDGGDPHWVLVARWYP
jgi:hypothetical protein